MKLISDLDEDCFRVARAFDGFVSTCDSGLLEESKFIELCSDLKRIQKKTLSDLNINKELVCAVLRAINHLGADNAMPINKTELMNRMSFKLETILGALLSNDDIDSALARWNFSIEDVL